MASIIFFVELAKTHNLRKIFNFRKELKKIKKKPLRVSPTQEGILLGHAGRKEIRLSDNCKHCFICGTTGTGKTVTISNFIQQGIEKNYPLLIIDGKGDTGKGSILDIVKKLSRGRKKLYVVNMSSPESSDTYNPFKNADTTMAKDMLINMTDWTEEHYKIHAERYIQRVLQTLSIADIPFSFKSIVQYLRTEKFIECSASLMKENLISKENHLENVELSKTSGKIAQSSIARFATICESEFGTLFSNGGIDISQALKEKAIILFVLNPLVYPELSPAVARLATIDAKKAVGKLFFSGIERTFFIMDEISTYANTSLTDLVNKSRSANVTCVLATQSLSDLDFACGEAFKEQIIENCNNYIVMRQNSGVNAEHWANILGTRATMEVTYQLQQKGLNTGETGFGSAKRVREFLYHPDEIKTLQTGKGIFLSRDTGITSEININKPF
jgi:Type IV secretory pathway, VirD4 components